MTCLVLPLLSIVFNLGGGCNTTDNLFDLNNDYIYRNSWQTAQKVSGPALATFRRGVIANGKAGYYLLSLIFGNLGGGCKTKVNLFNVNNDTYIHRNL